MVNIDNIIITWDQSENDNLFDQFGKDDGKANVDLERQHLSMVFFKKKATLNGIVAGLMGSMRLHLSAQDAGMWEKSVIGIFTIAVISPFELKIFKESPQEIFDLIESEYGDQYLNVEKLEVLYQSKPNLKNIVRSFVRKGLLEKEEDGKMFFSGTVLKNLEINFPR